MIIFHIKLTSSIYWRGNGRGNLSRILVLFGKFKGKRGVVIKNLFMHTSILRPSTTVPWRRSRARSASLLLANVTKPNPYMQKGQNKKHALKNSGSLKNNVQQKILFFFFLGIFFLFCIYILFILFSEVCLCKQHNIFGRFNFCVYFFLTCSNRQYSSIAFLLFRLILRFN